MSKIEKLPDAFLGWYWNHYADGYESPTYTSYDEGCEYGCMQDEYYRFNPEIVNKELNEWLLDHRSDNYILDKVRVWDSHLETSLDDFIKSYNHSKEEIKKLKAIEE